MKQVALIRGDGIGPEICDAVCSILDGAGAQVEWVECVAGLGALESVGDELPQDTLDTIRKVGVALKGPLTTPIGSSNLVGEQKNYRSVNIRLRQALALYANVRPIRSIPGVRSRYDGVDLIFIRENTEGLYSGLEHEVVPGVVTSLKVATRQACLRIAKYAFEYATMHKRLRVTGVHKANIMKLSDGLALDCYREVAEGYPEIKYDERIIDATAMALVMNPERFDVLVMENLYGDILSDLGAGLVGGLGMAPSANVGEAGIVYEAVHGSAPDIAGKSVANPTALLLSAVEMLKTLNQPQVASRIENAVRAVLAGGVHVTPDLGGKSTTIEFARAVVGEFS